MQSREEFLLGEIPSGAYIEEIKIEYIIDSKNFILDLSRKEDLLQVEQVGDPDRVYTVQANLKSIHSIIRDEADYLKNFGVPDFQNNITNIRVIYKDPQSPQESSVKNFVKEKGVANFYEKYYMRLLNYLDSILQNKSISLKDSPAKNLGPDIKRSQIYSPNAAIKEKPVDSQKEMQAASVISTRQSLKTTIEKIVAKNNYEWTKGQIANQVNDLTSSLEHGIDLDVLTSLMQVENDRLDALKDVPSVETLIYDKNSLEKRIDKILQEERYSWPSKLKKELVNKLSVFIRDKKGIDPSVLSVQIDNIEKNRLEQVKGYNKEMKTAIKGLQGDEEKLDDRKPGSKL